MNYSDTMRAVEALEKQLGISSPPAALSNGQPATPEPSLQTITIGGFTRELTKAALEAMATSQDDLPLVFQRGGALVRLIQTDGMIVVEEFKPDGLHGHLDRVADWVRKTKDGTSPASPPMKVVKDLLSLPSYPKSVLPLRGLIHAPVLLPDRRILVTPGYDAASGLYLDMGSLLGKIRLDMSMGDALHLLNVELLGDFPFINDGGRAHALALLLLPYVRPVIDGLIPLTLIDAPTPGNGKGLLVEVLIYPFLGRSANVMPQPGDNDEMRKAITSSLLQSERLIVLDNVTELKGASLSAALTAPVWSDRLLGQTKMLHLPNTAVWVATGNNVALSREQTRRTIPVRLDARVERPELRDGWRHPLPSWGKEHRADIVSAALSIVKHWADKGMPRAKATLGSFDEWAAVMGGILEMLEIKGFLTGRDELYAAADAETEEWKTFCTVWWALHGEKAVTAKDLLALVKDKDLLLDIHAGRSPLPAQQRLGYALRERRDRIFGDHIIRQAGRDSGTGSLSYRLEMKGKTPETTENPSPGTKTGQEGTGFSSKTPQNPCQTPQNPGGILGMKSGVTGVSGVSNEGQAENGEWEDEDDVPWGGAGSKDELEV